MVKEYLHLQSNGKSAACMRSQLNWSDCLSHEISLMRVMCSSSYNVDSTELYQYIKHQLTSKRTYRYTCTPGLCMRY